MSVKKIAITGATGFLGQSLPLNWSEKFLLFDLYHHRPDQRLKYVSHHQIDLLDQKKLNQIIDQIKPNIILHLAAKTHIDACQADKKLKQKGETWKINVEATKFLAQIAQKKKIHFIYLSTECVFDGQKAKYLENDPPKPLSWYGVTKYKAEQAIINSGCDYSILRAVIAYDLSTKASNPYQRIFKLLSQQKPCPLVCDQKITPTYLGDISLSLEKIIDERQLGIFHVAPGQVITPYQFGQIIAEHFGYPLQLVSPITLNDFFGRQKAKLRLTHACLDAKQTEVQLKLKFRSLSEVLSKL